MDPFQQRLFDRINYERKVKSGTQHFRLQGMRELLRRLGQPHLQYPVIHVAGTKGKGSTTTMMGEVLTQAGYRTGVYTSPHLDSLHERIAIDGNLVSNDDLEAVLERVFLVVDQMDAERNRQISQPTTEALPPNELDVGNNLPTAATLVDSSAPAPAVVLDQLTFFEITTAAAMVHFAQQRCDAVVLEVGLGGRLDSTNVCQPTACAITSISIDHTRQLGETTDKIAAEKAGIIKPGVPVVSGVDDKPAAGVIREVASKRGAPLSILGGDFFVVEQEGSFGCQGRVKLGPTDESDVLDGSSFDISPITLSLLGRHQQRNAALVVALAQVLSSQGWKINQDALVNGLKKARLAGRAEIVHRQPTVIMDIAHNLASIRALLETLRVEVPQWQSAARRVLLFGTSRDKPYREMLESLAPHFDEVVLTKYLRNPRARQVESLRQVLEHSGFAGKITTVEDPELARQAAQSSASKNGLVCITGSAFLVAELRTQYQV